MIAHQPWLAPLGITYTQYLVLLVLYEQDAQPLNAISHQLYLESATYNTKKTLFRYSFANIGFFVP